MGRDGMRRRPPGTSGAAPLARKGVGLLGGNGRVSMSWDVCLLEDCLSKMELALLRTGSSWEMVIDVLPIWPGLRLLLEHRNRVFEMQPQKQWSKKNVFGSSVLLNYGLHCCLVWLQ